MSHYLFFAITLRENDSAAPWSDGTEIDPPVEATRLVLPDDDGGAAAIACSDTSTVMMSLSP